MQILAGSGVGDEGIDGLVVGFGGGDGDELDAEGDADPACAEGGACQEAVEEPAAAAEAVKRRRVEGEPWDEGDVHLLGGDLRAGVGVGFRDARGGGPELGGERDEMEGEASAGVGQGEGEADVGQGLEEGEEVWLAGQGGEGEGRHPWGEDAGLADALADDGGSPDALGGSERAHRRQRPEAEGVLGEWVGRIRTVIGTVGNRDLFSGGAHL